jgi:hypothetical protein
VTVVCAAWRLALFGVAVALAPRAAWACAVCTGQDDAAVSLAMLKGTALLSLLPLALIGGLVWYLRRRAREVAAGRVASSGPEAPR